MAPSVSSSKPRQNVKKTLIQPVLPALPLLPKAPKPEPASVHEADSTPDVISIADRLGSSNNTALAESGQDTDGNGDIGPSVPEGVPVNDAEALKPEHPQEDASPKPLKGAEPPASAPLAELGEDNQVSTSLEVSSYRDGATQSAFSASSAEDSFYQQLRVQENSSTVSQQGSDGANDASHPTSVEQIQDTSQGVQLNGASTYHDADLTQNIIPGNEEGGSATAESSSHTKESVDEASVPNGHFPDIPTPGNGQPQQPLFPSSQHSRAASLTTTQLPSVSEHLLHLSVNKEWTDWMLMVNARGLDPYPAYAHGLLLIRSPRLTKLMNRQAPTQYAGNVINLYPPRIIVPHAFESALRFFYSDTVLTRDTLFPRQPTIDSKLMRRNSLEYLFSYWVSGIELGLEPIVSRSARLLEELVDWDVTDAIMKEAIDLDAITWRAGDEAAGISVDYAALALQLKQTVLSFCASRMNPAEFRPGISSFSSSMRSRFTQIEDSKVRHNPALASMVFGSMPSSTDFSPSSPQSEILSTVSSLEDQTASSILLNIDFDDLAFFSRQLHAVHGPAAASQLTSKLVDERESRRLKVVSNRAVPNKQRMTNSATWEVAGFREFVEDGQLGRERVGFLLPTKPR